MIYKWAFCGWSAPFSSIYFTSAMNTHPPLLLHSNNITNKNFWILYLYNKENIYAYIYTCINVLVQPGGDFYLWHVTLNETRRLPVNILQPNNSVCVFIYVLIDCKTCQIIQLCFTGETKCHLYSYVTPCHHLTSYHSMYYLPKPPFLFSTHLSCVEPWRWMMLSTLQT